MNGHKNPPKPFALIVWLDAHGEASEPMTEENIDSKHHGSEYQSYVWVLRSDAKGVMLASEWCPEDKEYRATMFVPRGMVSEEIHITLSKKAVVKKKVKAAETEEVPAAISALVIEEVGN